MILARAQSASLSQPPVLSKLTAVAGHLALWPAIYAGAVLCCFLQLAGLWRCDHSDAIAIACVVTTALGTYLLDRVKIMPGLMDPADRIANPERYRFLHNNNRVVRLLAVASLLMGAALASQLSHWAPLLVLCSAVGAAIYAPIPRVARPRLKDILLVKNIYTAAGLIALAALISLITFLPGYRPLAWEHLIQAPATICAAFLLGLRVTIDAILCDIQDESADRISRTKTAVTYFGKTRVKHACIIAELLLAIALAYCLPLAPVARQLWSLSLIITTVLLNKKRDNSSKDFIDFRLALEAIAITIILALRFHLKF